VILIRFCLQELFLMNPATQAQRKKMIVVLGPPNSGKTTAIREFVARRPYNYLRKTGPGEILVAIPVRRQNQRLWVGVASKGDSVNDVNNVLSQLFARNCDAIVCAARPGAVLQAVEKLAQANGFAVQQIGTTVT
jgi:predicted phosphoribosyltransferase